MFKRQIALHFRGPIPKPNIDSVPCPPLIIVMYTTLTVSDTYLSFLEFSPFYVLLPYIIYVMPSGRFHISRISLPDGKRAGQKVQLKIAAAVQNVKPLYLLSRSFEISETNCQQSFF